MNTKISIQIEKTEAGYTAHSPEVAGSQITSLSLNEVMGLMAETVTTYLSADQSEPKTTGKSLLELFDRVTNGMTESEIAQLPTDAAEQHDRYLV